MNAAPARQPSRLRPWRWAIVGGLLLLAAAAALFTWLRFTTRRPLAEFEESRLRHQIASLRLYAERRALPSFLPPGDAVLALREEFLQAVLDGSLPFRQRFADGKYEAVLDSATLHLEDGLGSVSLSGHGQRAGETDPGLSVALDLQGFLSRAGVDTRRGTLGLGVIITDVRLRQAGPAMLNPLLVPVARYFGGQKAEEWNRNPQTLDVPIRLDQRISMPEIKGALSIAGQPVPAAARVSAATVLERRLAVSLELLPDSTTGEAPGSRDSAWEREMEHGGMAAGGPPDGDSLGHRLRLEWERARLVAEVRGLAARDTLWRALRASDRDVCAVLPADLLQRIARRLTTHYLRGAAFDFDPKVRAHVDQEIRVKVLGKGFGAGHIRGDVRVSHLGGHLRPGGPPDLRIEPPDQVLVRIPVRVADGRGDIRLVFEWDPTLLTSVVCRGFDFEERVQGDVVPFGHTVTARVHLAIADSGIVGVTRLRRDRVAVPAEPTPASLAKIRQAIEGQDRFLRCGIAIDADSVVAALVRMVRRGVKVRLPGKLLKPFHLPLWLEQEFVAGDYRLRARAYDPEFVLRPGYLRFGFRARLAFHSPTPASAVAGAARTP